MRFCFSLSHGFSSNIGVFQVILSDRHHSVDAYLCYYMTSFNYGGKEARDVGLTCRCHLSNIMPDSMPDSIFYDSMGWGIAFLIFLRVITTVFLSIKEMDSVVLSL